MNKILHTVPFLRILVPYISGIIIAYKLLLCWQIILGLLFFLLIGLLFFNSKNTLKFHQLTAIIFTIFLLVSGYLRFQKFNTLPEFTTGKYYCATLFDYPTIKTKSYKANVLLTKISTNDSVMLTKEKLIIYFSPDSSVQQLLPGDQIIFKTKPNQISNPGNPYEFDFQQYLSFKKIYRQVYLTTGKWFPAGKSTKLSPIIEAEKIRHKLLLIYKKNNITDEKFAILSALTLGYKEALDPDTKQVFSSAGAMHVLAVSGLHVGIIYLVVKLAFGFLRRNPRGKILFILFSTITLWLFALVTGLSPSVLRATVMFSFLIIGENMRRPTNIYNTLTLSAFILLIFNPNLIFELGFQLSYSAVFGIVFFQPKINNLFSFKYKPAKWAWSLFSVSVAAQLATFPLTLFYFNQFPTYFWISNFIVIPAAFILIFLGIAIIMLSPIPVISSFFAVITSELLSAIYFSLSFFQKLPLSVIQNIHISNSQLLLLFTFIFLLIQFISSKKRTYLFLIFCSGIFVCTLNITHKITSLKQRKIIFYNSTDNLVVHLISGASNYIINENKLNTYESTSIKNVCTYNHLQKPIYIKCNENYQDELLFKKNKFISFNGKNIIAGNEITKLPSNIFIDFIVTNKVNNITIINDTKLIKQTPFFMNDTAISNYFILKKEGAFIYKF